MKAVVPLVRRLYYRIGEELNSKKERFIGLSLGGPGFNMREDTFKTITGYSPREKHSHMRTAVAGSMYQPGNTQR